MIKWEFLFALSPQKTRFVKAKNADICSVRKALKILFAPWVKLWMFFLQILSILTRSKNDDFFDTSRPFWRIGEPNWTAFCQNIFIPFLEIDFLNHSQFFHEKMQSILHLDVVLPVLDSCTLKARVVKWNELSKTALVALPWQIFPTVQQEWFFFANKVLFPHRC